jgi:hypothetical protein
MTIDCCFELRDGDPYCKTHDNWEDSDGHCPGRDADESRARAIRAVVAAQWGAMLSVAVTLDAVDASFDQIYWCAEPYGLASLPSAVDIVDGGGA